MKNSNRVLVVLLVLFLIVSFAGCSPAAPNNEPGAGAQEQNATPEPTPKPLTADEIVLAVMSNMREIKSMDAVMNTELDIEMMGQRQASSTRSTMTSFSDPQRVKLDIEMSIMDEKVGMQTYMEQEGDVLYIYTYVMDQWTRNEASMDEYDARISQYDAKSSMDIYLNSAKNFKSVGQETISGVATEKIQGILAGEDLGNAILESGSLNDMLQGGMEIGIDDLNSMLADLGDMPMTIWVDKENLMAMKFEFDMADVLDTIYKNIFGAMGVDAESIITHKYIVTMEYLNINSGTPFTIPPEAKEAA